MNWETRKIAKTWTYIFSCILYLCIMHVHLRPVISLTKTNPVSMTQTL